MYIVVEEMLGDRVVLSISDWPWIDAKGRLVFSGHTREAPVEREGLEAVLRIRRRIGQSHSHAQELEGAAQRRVAVGDVYASRVQRPSRGRLPRRAEDLLGDEVNDVSAAAREAAQASFLAAVTAPLSPERARRMLDLRDEQDG